MTILLLDGRAAGWRWRHPPPPLPAMPALAGAARATRRTSRSTRAVRDAASPATWGRSSAAIRSGISASRCRRGGGSDESIKERDERVHFVDQLACCSARSRCTSPGLLRQAGSGDRADGPAPRAMRGSRRGRYFARQQRARRLGEVLLARDVERGLAAIVLDAGSRAGGEQHPDGLRLAEAGGPHQRREVVAVDRVRVDARRRAASRRSPCGLRRRHRSSRSCRGDPSARRIGARARSAARCVLPAKAAAISGVTPLIAARFTSAPASSKHRREIGAIFLEQR